MCLPASPLRLLALLAVALTGALALPLAATAVAQGYYNQERLAELLHSRRDSLELIPEVTYRYHVLEHETNNSIFARHDLYLEIGDGDVERGKAHIPLLEFLTRQKVDRLAIGDTLILPTPLGQDLRAYAPFPRYYEGAADLPKFAVIHKKVQAWAAYEHGRLIRWGLVNTGSVGHETPGGRYNFNWRALERISSESPPGEVWLMRYVLNFHNERGFHTHQYAMPTGAPASHGCVRMIEDDARWLYNWADPWVTTAGRGVMGGNILRQGTMLLVLGDGEEPRRAPPRYRHTPYGPEAIVVELPDDPYSVKPGTGQQRHFDRQRAAATRGGTRAAR